MTASATNKTAAELRNELNCPVIDNDSHTMEIPAVLAEYVRQLGSGADADAYLEWTGKVTAPQYGRGHNANLAERTDAWIGKSSWWSNTVNSYDRATSQLPKLYAERMESLGFDFAIVYPTLGLFSNRAEDDRLRPIYCRATNMHTIDTFKGLHDKMAPIGVIPFGNPTEALEELEFLAENGFKAALLSSASQRDIPKLRREKPEVADHLKRLDFYGLDSIYDYDPFWRRAEELGMPLSFHGQTLGSWGGVSMPSNHIFHRVSKIGVQYPELATSLMLGGVTTRFPKLKFQFAEAGVGWLTCHYMKMQELWGKRGKNIEQYNPALLDVPYLKEQVMKYGTEMDKKHIGFFDGLKDGLVEPEVLNEFGLLGVSNQTELKEHYESRFYAGCEADDWGLVHAFGPNPRGIQLKMTFGSDVGHWDVADCNDIMHEALELRDEGLITEKQAKKFLFANAAELYTTVNPDFFKGTVLEKKVWEQLEIERS